MADERTNRLDADSDAQLVLAAQAGCPDAFTELFRRHYPSVRRACLRRLGNDVDAEEAAQATFVRAFERLEQCEGQRRFGGWVNVIAHRVCVDTMRARARTKPEEVPVPVEQPSSGAGNPEQSVLDQERVRLLREALSMLSERQRDAVVARTVEERGPGEIAAELGLSVGAVDSLLLRGRRRLARAYKRFSDERGTAAAATVFSTATAATAATVASGAAARPRRVVSGVSAAVSHVHHSALQLASTVGLLPASRPPGHGVATAVLTAVLAVQSAPTSSVLADRHEPFATPPPSVMTVRTPLELLPADSVGSAAVSGTLTALVGGLLDAARPPAEAAELPATAETAVPASGAFEPRSLAGLAEELLGPLVSPTPLPGGEAAMTTSLEDGALQDADKPLTPTDSTATKPAAPKSPTSATPRGETAEKSDPQPDGTPPEGNGQSSDVPAESPTTGPVPADPDPTPPPPLPAVPPASSPPAGGVAGPVKDLTDALANVEDARQRRAKLLP